MLKGGNPNNQGLSYEGTFTIPVCDISKEYDDFDDLVEYAYDGFIYENVFDWSQPICSGDKDHTKEFKKAMHDSYQAPTKGLWCLQKGRAGSDDCTELDYSKTH